MNDDRLQRAFRSGMGGVIELFPPPLDITIPPLTLPQFPMGDLEALRSDWDAVGRDIHSAISIVSEELDEQIEVDASAEEPK